MFLLLLAAFYLLESVQSIERYALLNTRLHFYQILLSFQQRAPYVFVFLSQRVNFSKFSFDFLPCTQLSMNSNSGFLASFWYLKIQTLKSSRGLYTGPAWSSNGPPLPRWQGQYNDIRSLHIVPVSAILRRGDKKTWSILSGGDEIFVKLCGGIRKNGVLIYKILFPHQVIHNECSLSPVNIIIRALVPLEVRIFPVFPKNNFPPLPSSRITLHCAVYFGLDCIR